MNLFNKKYEGTFSWMEDWDPWDQLKPIPLFYNKNRYYFFYGIYEKSYEFLQKYIDMFLVDANYEIKENLSKLFVTSLDFQTQLLESMIEIEESKNKVEGIYIPNEVYLEKLKTFFSISSIDEFKTVSYELSEFQLSEEELLEKLQNFTLFEKFFIEFNDKYFIVFPQNHIQSLYYAANQFIANNRIELGDCTSNLKKCLASKALKHFSIKSCVDVILNKDYKSLTTDIDFISIVDNKLFLFKQTDCSGIIDCTSEVKKTVSKIKDTIKLIKKENEIGVATYGGTIGVKTNELEILGFVIYENTHLDKKLDLDAMSDNIILASWIDIKCLFETFELPISLFKFYRDVKELKSKAKLMMADFLDIVPRYIDNNNSFLVSGTFPTHVIVQPHEWHNYYYNNLSSKETTDTKIDYLRKEYHDKFNKIDKISENIYSFIDTSYLDGGLLIKSSLCENVLVLFPQNGYFLNSETVKSYSTLLGPIYANFIDSLKENILLLLNELNEKFDKFVLIIYPSDYVNSNKSCEEFKGKLDFLTNENPIYTETNSLLPRVIKTFIIYDLNKLSSKFDSPFNDGEKYCVQKLIESLTKYFFPDKEEKEILGESREFIDKNIPKAPKKYSLDIFNVPNQKLKDYSQPIKGFESELSKVNQEIAEYFKERKVEQRIYTGEEALEINDIIFKFIGNRIVETIKYYDETLLLFAFNQVELAEGLRETTKIQRDVDAQNSVEFDVAKEHYKNINETSNLALSSKLIVQFILKVNPNGKSKINNVEWNYIQALAMVYFDTSLIYDYIKFNIQEHTIEVTSSYQLNDFRGDYSYNIDKFFESTIDLQIQNKKQNNKNTIDLEELFLGFSTDIYKEFKVAFGFEIKDLMTMLYVLGHSNIKNDVFPLTLLPLSDLKKYLLDNINDLDQDIIAKIIEFCKLDFDTYKGANIFIPTKVNNSKERINICPLIILDDKVLFGNQLCLLSVDLWIEKLAKGDFPFLLEEEKLLESINKYRKAIETEVENKSISISENALGKDNVVANFKKFSRIKIEKEGEIDCGEIDILAINREMKTIYVLEAKHKIRRISPYDNFVEFNKFINKKKSYLVKLIRKTKFVKLHENEILDYFQVTNKDNWSIKRGFVVIHNYPSAFHNNNNVDFILMENLEEYLL